MLRTLATAELTDANVLSDVPRDGDIAAVAFDRDEAKP